MRTWDSASEGPRSMMLIRRWRSGSSGQRSATWARKRASISSTISVTRGRSWRNMASGQRSSASGSRVWLV